MTASQWTSDSVDADDRSGLVREIAKAVVDIEERRRELHESDRRRLLTLEPELYRKRDQIANLEAANRRATLPPEIRAQVEAQSRQIEAVYASWSWRITLPLRRIYGALRRARPRS